MSQDLRVIWKIEGFLADFSRALVPDSNEASVKAIYKRLDKNLGNFDLTRPYERAQAKMLSKVDENFLFIFDPSEVVKPFAEKMEGLALVRDASEKPRKIKSAAGKMVEKQVLKPGYPLRVAIAMSPSGDILPVELALYSYASEFFLSTNDENIQAMETLLHKTRLMPVLVLDREFDSYSIIRHLASLRQRFIIRMKKNRKFRIAGAPIRSVGGTYTREEMCRNYAFLFAEKEITYSKRGKEQTYLFEIRASYVALLSETKTSGLTRDEGDHEALTLIQVKIKKESGAPVFYLLTNSRPKTPEELIRAAQSYLARWNVEEYIRFLKQHFSLESFLVRDLGRIKNLVKATYIATVIIHLLTDRRSNFGFKTHHQLIEKSQPVSSPKKSRDFFLYAYGRGLANIVSLNKKLFAAPLRAKENSPTSQLDFELKY